MLACEPRTPLHTCIWEPFNVVLARQLLEREFLKHIEMFERIKNDKVFKIKVVSRYYRILEID